MNIWFRSYADAEDNKVAKKFYGLILLKTIVFHMVSLLFFFAANQKNWEKLFPRIKRLRETVNITAFFYMIRFQ